MYQPNTKAWLFDYSSEYFHVLCPATTFSLISLFVLDTPAYLHIYRFYGKHREVTKRLAAGQFHGNRTPPGIARSRPHWLRRFYT